jgi:hypothetical protein
MVSELEGNSMTVLAQRSVPASHTKVGIEDRLPVMDQHWTYCKTVELLRTNLLAESVVDIERVRSDNDLPLREPLRIDLLHAAQPFEVGS